MVELYPDEAEYKSENHLVINIGVRRYMGLTSRVIFEHGPFPIASIPFYVSSALIS